MLSLIDTNVKNISLIFIICPLIINQKSEAMNDRKKWWERVRDIRASLTTWWWWWVDGRMVYSNINLDISLVQIHTGLMIESNLILEYSMTANPICMPLPLKKPLPKILHCLTLTLKNGRYVVWNLLFCARGPISDWVYSLEPSRITQPMTWCNRRKTLNSKHHLKIDLVSILLTQIDR